MEPLRLPSEIEINAAYDQGKKQWQPYFTPPFFSLSSYEMFTILP